MTEATFWSIIGVADLNSFNEDIVAGAISSRLGALSTGDLQDYSEILAAKLYALDTRLHAENAGDSGGSSDAFLYARCFVVAMGQVHYEQVLADPSKMSTSLDHWCEPLLYLANRIESDRTETHEHFDTRFSYETGSNRIGWTT